MKARLTTVMWVAMFCGILLSGCAASGIKVLVVNKAAGPVQNMKITYTGGSLTIERLDPGASYRKTIKPTAASGVDVEFNLASGEKKTESIRADLEPGYEGDLRLEITPEGRIGWEKHLQLSGKRLPRGRLAPVPGN